MPDSAAWITDALAQMTREGLLRSRRCVSRLADGGCLVDGQPCIDFASNDYLNLACHPRLVEAATAAMRSCGVGSRASALVCGRTDWHVRLEQRIARFECQPQALLYPTGMAANVGTVSALCGPGDLVLCDRLNHASLVDGCRLSGARLRVYRHSDLSTVIRELEKSTGERRRWIVTDAVFSMDGDLAPLEQLCEIAERFDANLIVDEAHGTGVFGPHGRGACESLHIEDRVFVRIGTLSKAIGTLGGFVAGTNELVEYLWNRSRTQIYSTALPAAVCAAAIASFDLIEEEPWRRSRLATASEAFRKHLLEQEVQPFPGSQGPIIPIAIPDPKAAVEVAARLLQRGFVVGAIRPPTVPRQTSRLRIVVTVAHSDEELAGLAIAIAEEIRAALPDNFPSP